MKTMSKNLFLTGTRLISAVQLRHWGYSGLIVGVLLALVVSPTVAAAPPLTVKSDGPAKFWNGQVTSTGPTTPSIAECKDVHCDHTKIKVKLPHNIWKKRPGGLEISIRWQGGFTDIVRLFVYKDGKRVAASTAQVGQAQSVLIPSAKNGTYHVYAAYTPGAESDTIAYEGLTEVEYAPKAFPPRDLLPDLQALPQENVTFNTPQFDLFEPAPAPGETCFDSEKAEFGAQTCLRFDQIMANIGDGALDLRFSRQTGVLQDEPAFQRIYRSTGGFSEISVGDVEFHDIHGHYHFKSFAESVLWQADSSHNRVGNAPVAAGNKVSFCIADTNLHFWGLKGNGPTSYPAPNCLEPFDTQGTTEFFKQGMAAGFADRYTWDLPTQYIEVSGLANGDYILDTIVDPDNLLTEHKKSNNCVSVIVRLTNMGTPARHAEILGAGPACPNVSL